MGAAVIVGGLTKDGKLACDIWVLDVDMLIDHIE
jgi:hypothetical protein